MAPCQDLLELLSAVIPEYLKLAAFFTGDDKAALSTRQNLDKEPFYTKLHVEFKGLEEILSVWDNKIEIPGPIEHTLTKALDVLESRFVKIQDRRNYQRTVAVKSKYPRLRDLRCRIDTAQDSNSSLDVQELQRMIHLEDKRKEYRTHMVSRLTKCNTELGQLARKAAPRQRRSTPRAKPERDSVQTRVSSALPSSQIRDHATLLYKILAQNWNCNGHSPHTATKLRLATHRKDESEARFEMVFCSTSGISTKWQESEVRLVPQKSKSLAAAPTAAKAKSVTFAVPIKEQPPASTKSEDRWRVEGICKLVEAVAARTSCQLKLLVEDDELWYLSPGSATENIQRKDPVCLGDFLKLESPFPFERAKKRDRCILQVMLANGLLHFYKGPWLLREWNKAHICFYQARSQLIPDLTRPYLSTQCSPLDDSSEEEDSHLRVHPYPGILALGILLLEIELGQPIECDRPDDSPNNGKIFHIDADRPVAMEMLEKCRDDSSIDFINAVEACLDDRTFTGEFGRDASFNDLAFRRQIFEVIVKPLEDALQKVFGMSVEKLDALAPAALSLPDRAGSQRRQLPSHPAQVAPHVKTLPVMEESKSVVVGQAEKGLSHQVCLYDDSEESSIVSEKMYIAWLYLGLLKMLTTNSSKRTDKWFADLHDRVHPLIQKTETRPVDSQAILDTGLELPEEAECAYGDRLRDQKSWLSHDEDCKEHLNRGDRDLDGHGTHAASLLLQVAPEADVYIARVFKDRKESKGIVMAEMIHQRIADAIKHAVKEWEVDIISMSFGFEQSVDVIDEAIRLADDKKVIMLAAASNEGGNNNIAWPARLAQVICIYATDSLGNRCDFTPTDSPRDDNFAVLGEAVKSCWPPHKRQAGEVRKSGTSTATPIAAGIAAIVLEYVNLVLPQWDRELSKNDAEMLRKLRSSAGMSTVFRQMAKRNRGGYDYVVPWDFLDTKKYKGSTVCDIILGDLKAL
ncbi:uncharacterized protein PAC_10213 [Phialocephala subalpina]|uniref:Uncharacterized protein n=1 Tax=Phialocephala subalpina TaxID=576137 RepID=A0A1L7X5M1_9HELO|nr:uncharacterized protein PAC_10213 [Phialocephala subalpina]